VSGFTVAGVLDNTLYEVKVTGNKADPVVGSKRVKGLFRQYEGQKVSVTPVGPAYTVDGGDPASVLALLSVHTKVTRAGGDGETVPRLLDDPVEDVTR
jgi:hypothetical protein